MKRLLKGLFCIAVAGVLAFRCMPAYGLDFNAEELYNSVFVIYSGNSLGSGFAIGSNCIITNAHVVSDRNGIKLKSYSGNIFPASIVALDEGLDIAVLSVHNAEFPYLKTEDYNKLSIGDDVYAIGAPESLEFTLTKGILSAKDRHIGDYKYLQIDAAINSGNSGGPLLNSTGKVIGVNTLKRSGSEGIGFSIPMTEVLEFLSTKGIDPGENVITAKPEATPTIQPQDGAEGEVKPSQPSPFWGQGSYDRWMLYGLAAVVLLAAIVIVLVYNKNATKRKKYSSKDRTDFDIEVYEQEDGQKNE